MVFTCYCALEKEKNMRLESTNERTLLEILYEWADQEGIPHTQALEAAVVNFLNCSSDEFIANQQDPRFRFQTEDEEMNSAAMLAEMLRKDPNLFEEIEGWNTLDDETKEEV